MGTVDIEQTVEEVLQSDNILWDGKTPSFEKVEGIVRDVVTKVTERHYSMNDGEIDDWQVWEHDIVSEVNNRLERLSIDE
jgi:hypothetical protein